MAKKALLIVNRHARKGKQHFAQVVDLLHNLDFECILVPIKTTGELTQAVHRYGKQVNLVIVGGGDGTLNGIVDTLVDYQLPLGILPLGTANDLARTLLIPSSIPEACQVIADGYLKAIDLGWVNGKYFFNVASLGLGVKITEKLTKGAKRRWGVLAYVATAIQVLSQTRPFHADIIVDGKTTRVRTIQIAVGNGRYYGGGMAIADDAAIDDRRLDLYSLELLHWWQIFPLLSKFPKGQHGLLPWVESLEGEEIIIHTRREHAINTDGELTAVTPATFRVVPKILNVFAPR
jgi:YegS/Rv2252/BmrU family lipid kinase